MQKLFLDGNWLKLDKYVSFLLDSGLACGWGIFETIRYRQGRVEYLKEHLARFYQSAPLLKLRIAYPPSYLKEKIEKIAKLNKLKDARIKLIAFKKEKRTSVAILAQKYKAYPLKKYKEGLCVCISQLRQDKNSPFVRLKTLNRLFYELAWQEAKEKGCDEALIFNREGFLCEASRANVFILKNKKIYTPTLSCGCLAGVMRKVAMDSFKKAGIKVYAAKLSLKDVLSAQAMFLTNSLVGIIPVAKIYL